MLACRRTLAWMLVFGGLNAVAEVTAQAADDPVVFREEGEASYYGDELEGEKTASGEPFDPDKLTAAHPELPLGSEVTVTNPDTGQSVEVEVNDRGPFVGDRDIDLSEAAAKELGITEEGVAEVEIEATKSQVEEAIDTPKEQPKVEEALGDARAAAAQDGTPQPKPLPELSPAE